MTATVPLVPAPRVLFAPDRQADLCLIPGVVLPAETEEQAPLLLKPEELVPVPEIDLGQGPHADLVAVAQVEARGETEDHGTPDTRFLSVDRPPRRRSYMGHYALQLLDVQKLRVATANRVSAMERDEVPAHWMLAAKTVLADLEKLEAFLGRQLAKQGREHFMADWISSAPGISLAGFARLIGLVGPLENFATVSKLWAYCGLHVVDGQAPKRRKGEKANWSPQARVLCHQIGDAIVKVGRGPYRADYDRKKAEYELLRLDWTQAHRHEAAMRYAVKCLLRDMWQAWRQQSRA